MTLTKAEWPGRSCREHVWYSVGAAEEAIPMAALCELPEHEDDGPHVNFGVAVSIQARQAWMKHQGMED